MVWTTLPLYTSGTLTPAMLNAIRDNINESAVAKASGSSWPAHYVANGPNQLAERLIMDNNVDTTDTTTSTSYTASLATTTGPSVTLTTGSRALVFHGARMQNNTTGQIARATFQVNGDGGNGGRDVLVQGSNDIRSSAVQLISTTPGSVTFQEMYRADSSGTATFTSRRLCVMGL